MSKTIRLLRNVPYQILSQNEASKALKKGKSVNAIYISERLEGEGYNYNVTPLSYKPYGTKKGITIYVTESDTNIGAIPLSENDFIKYQTKQNVSNFVKKYVAEKISERQIKEQKKSLDEDQLLAVYTLTKSLPYDQWKNLLTNVVKTI